MFKSMTAYGRAIHTSALGRFVVELHSVNRKHLEINTHLPPLLIRFDAEIKRWVAESIGRGQINLKISATFDHFTPVRLSANLPLVRQYFQAWKNIVEDLALPPSQEIFLQMLAQQEIYLFEQDELEGEKYHGLLKDLVSQVLKQVNEMRAREGQLLHKDITARFARLPLFIKEIQRKAPGATMRFRQRLLSRISELTGANAENEERILKEIGIYAEKVDIEEELTRLESHLQQVQELINIPSEGVGKILEFLVQELNREVNTIGSKSSDLEVSRCVIEIKSELERIREQIQNIE